METQNYTNNHLFYELQAFSYELSSFENRQIEIMTNSLSGN